MKRNLRLMMDLMPKLTCRIDSVDGGMVGAAEDYAVGGEEAEVGEEEEEAAARLWCGGNAMTFA